MSNQTDATNLLVDELIIYKETTGYDASRINGNKKIHNRIIQKMVRSGIIDSNKHEKSFVQQKHQQKSIYASYIVHYTKNQLTLNGMVKITASINS